MPEEGIERYLQTRRIDLSKLPSDEVLVEQMQEWIQKHKDSKRRKMLGESNPAPPDFHSAAQLL